MNEEIVARDALNSLSGRSRDEIVEQHISYVAKDVVKITLQYNSFKEMMRMRRVARAVKSLFIDSRSYSGMTVKLKKFKSEITTRGAYVVTMDEISTHYQYPVQGKLKDKLYDLLYYKLYF